jgi:hypothetical protein
MRAFKSVFDIMLIIIKGLFILLQLVVLFIRALIEKQTACSSFRRQLRGCNLPPEVVNRLTGSYRDTLSLNVFSYMKGR